MVSNKFLYDDGEGDEVFSDEWAASGGMSVGEVVKHEREFLNAIVSESNEMLNLQFLPCLPNPRIGRCSSTNRCSRRN